MRAAHASHGIRSFVVACATCCNRFRGTHVAEHAGAHGKHPWRTVLTHAVTRDEHWRAVVCGGTIVGFAVGTRRVQGLFLAPTTLSHGWGREAFGFAIAVQKRCNGALVNLSGGRRDDSQRRRSRGGDPQWQRRVPRRRARRFSRPV
jgi:hypothetical protein